MHGSRTVPEPGRAPGGAAHDAAPSRRAGMTCAAEGGRPVAPEGFLDSLTSSELP